MAKKKTPARKTTKKSGAKKKATKSRVTKKAARKTPAVKRRVSPPAREAKSVVKKKAAKKTKTRRNKLADRIADRVTRPTRHKPETGGRQAKHEILEFFGSGQDLRSLTKEELNEKKLVFLRAFANRGIIRDGCLAAGISMTPFSRWKEDDVSFAEACKQAELLAADRLEAEAHRRAFDGYDKPVIYQGEITATYTEYSDSLMNTLMKGYKKDKYKERQEHSGSIGRPLTLDTETKESVVSSLLGMIVNKPDPK